MKAPPPQHDGDVHDEVLIIRLSEIEANVASLKRILEMERNIRLMLKDEVKKAATERFLERAIEATIASCLRIISMKRLKLPEKYAEIPPILSRARIISEGFSEKLARMFQFRNVLVHQYYRIEDEKLEGIIRENIKDFGVFIEEIKNFLKVKR